ncbi:porin family protein [Fluviicola sp.]|uniref:porin family protein n=1 Tax=Fluviicola sp. TaxID=1917219 RepID=UPI003D2D12A1
MKKILMIVVAILTFAAAFAQENPEKKNKTLSIGPSVGFGHTGIRNTSGTDIFKPSWSAGLIFNYSSLKHLGFSADVLWSMEGGRIESAGSTTDLTFQYIRIPLKAVYYFGGFEDNFRPKITVGPSMGFLIDAVSDTDMEGGSKVNVKSFYEKFDIGLNASIGFNLKLVRNIWLNTDFNYYTGLTAIRGNLYNSNFGVKVGVAFGL